MDRQLLLWAALVALTVPLLVQLKPVPALVLSLVPILPVLVPERWRRPALWFVLSAWGAVATAASAIALTFWAFPAVTADGHGVMPIGQVLVGGALGAVAGGVTFGRTTPQQAGDVARMARLCACAAPVLLVVCGFDHL